MKCCSKCYLKPNMGGNKEKVTAIAAIILLSADAIGRILMVAGRRPFYRILISYQRAGNICYYLSGKINFGINLLLL